MLVETPPPFTTEAFVDAGAAVARLEEIYERNTRFLRDRFEAYVNGGAFTTRVRACYPFVRMTTSTHADAPRGMNFLYSLNRLNVATSRARCLSILVCSPALFEPECRTPEQMQMANAFCRYLEMASTL